MLEAVRALPDHLRDALWRVESARLEPVESSGLVVCGMGGSAIGGDLAAAALGPRLGKPLDVVRGYALPVWTPTDRAVLCSSYSGNTEETVACYAAAEALGANRVVATTGGTSGRVRAPRRRPGDRPARRPAAARRGRLHVHRRRRGRGALCGLGLDPHRDRRSRRAPRERARRARRARGGARGGARRHRAGRLRRRPDGAGRLPLEDPGQREREAAGVLEGAPRARPQRDRGLGGRRRGRAPELRDPHRPRPAPARAPPLRAHGRADRAARRARGDDRDRGRDANRAPAVVGHARRPRLARARGAARRRPDAGRGDRAPQGRARPAVDERARRGRDR